MKIREKKRHEEDCPVESEIELCPENEAERELLGKLIGSEQNGMIGVKHNSDGSLVVQVIRMTPASVRQLQEIIFGSVGNESERKLH